MESDEHLYKLDLKKPWNADTPSWDVEQKVGNVEFDYYNGAEATLWNIEDGSITTVGGWFSLVHGPLTDPAVWGPPIITNKHYQLPEGRIFTYNLQNKKWTSLPLENGEKRVAAASSATSVRNRIGYMLGGVYVNEEQEVQEDYLPSPVGSDWLETMSSYDLSTKTWDISLLPKEIGFTLDGHLLSLDRVGKDGVLILINGQEKVSGNTQMVMSLLLCKMAMC